MKVTYIAGTVLGQIPSDIDFEPESNTGMNLAEFAGRNCYQAWSRPNPATATNAGYIRNIIKQGHLSVLEHASASFMIEGVSRSLTHELVRHRVGFSYCLSGDTVVYSSKYGKSDKSQVVKLSDLYEQFSRGGRHMTAVRNRKIRTVDNDNELTMGRIASVAYSGRKEVFTVKTSRGYSIKSTLDHLFMTGSGEFSRIGDIGVGGTVMVNGAYRPAVKIVRDAEWMRFQVDNGKSTADIAELAGCSMELVRKWRLIHGCPGRVGGSRGVPWNAGMSGEYQLPPLSDGAKRKISKKALSRANYHSWTNTRAAARRLFPELLYGPCSVCGYSPPQNPSRSQIIELDHINSDPTDNSPENVQPLCVACHHAKTKGSLAWRVFTDTVVSIEPAGIEDTYDIEMLGEFKRFVANGFVVHNSQLSQRYVDESEVEFVEPEVIAKNPQAHQLFMFATGAALDAYRSLVDVLSQDVDGLTGFEARKAVRQAARSVLPNATETKIVVTANYRAWRDMLIKRGSPHADVEIRAVAVEILSQLKAVEPNAFFDMFVYTDDKGRECIGSDLDREV